MNRIRRPRAYKRRNAFFLVALTLLAIGSIAWYWMRCPGCTPSWFAFGMPNKPFTVLVLGTDVQYSRLGARRQLADRTAFTGRSDTMMLVMVDPQRRTVRGINIPRDTMVNIPGYGYQKINAANAIGGPMLAAQTVADTIGVNIDHYVVLNVQGLVDAVNEIGGVTVHVPKKLSYMDWTAKLKIDIDSGVHTLTGNQAMGFVRFRHDDLGDIGRIQRQQIFMRALLAKLLNPVSWPHFPQLVAIAHHNVLSDMGDGELFQVFNLVRNVPKNEIQFAMLPGRFGSDGSWVPDTDETNKVVSRMYGALAQPEDRHNLTITIKDASSNPELAERTARRLRELGYSVSISRGSTTEAFAAQPTTRIIAQRGNYDDAQMVQHDLGDHGEIVGASIGDIYSSITIYVANDLQQTM